MSALDDASPPLLPLAGEVGSAKRGRVMGEGRGALAIEGSAVLACVLLAASTIGCSYETVVLVVTLAAAPLVVWIVAQDLRSLTIADGAVVGLAVLALDARHAAGDPLVVLVVDVLLSGGVLLAFREIYYRRRGFDGLGLGDVKLAAAGGLLVGGQAFAWVLLVASLLALGSAAVARLRGSAAAGTAAYKLAFGAFLAPALYATWVALEGPVLWPGGA